MAWHDELTGDDAIHEIMYVQTSDPGAVGANKFWLDTTGGATMTAGAILKQRDGSNASWTTRGDIKTALDLKAALASPAFTGTPTAPTAAGGTNTTQIATTAFVSAAVGAGGVVASVFGRTGAVVAVAGDYDATHGGTGQTTYATGDILYASASNTLSKLTASTNGFALVQTSGVPAWVAQYVALPIVIGDGTNAITTGVKGFIEIPFACAIVQATTLADASGSIVIDIWKDTYANYPPTVADTITASAKPTLSSATKAQDATLTGWTTSISAGDILGFNVDSATTVKQVTLSLKLRRT